MSTAMPFQEFQRAFAHHVRSPRKVPPPAGVPRRPMRLYGELLYNNLVGFIDACFPVSRQVLGERRWGRLARHFFSEWRCSTPWFREIPREFLRWLDSGGAPMALPPYLLELVHYEWVELAVDVLDAEPDWARIDVDGDLLEGRPAVNPALMNLSYRWPVHLVGPAYRPRKPRETNLVVFRDGEGGVRFSEFNAVSARLLALLLPGQLTGAAACQRIAGELRHPDPERLTAHGHGLLKEMAGAQIILGVLK